MKVEVTNNKEQKPFPKLMNCEDGVIYYFVREGYGLPIHNWDENKFKSFENLDASHWCGVKLTDFEGAITLSND